jgi:ketosteroid isomerase-like protein
MSRSLRLMFAPLTAPLLMLSPGAAGAADSSAAPQVVALAHRYIDAQRDFDVPALRAATADNFIEISPIGELDEREKVLGFYAPAKKKPGAPTITTEDGVTRVFGDAAVHITTHSFTVMAEDKPRSVSMRAVFVAHLRDGQWKLVSVQYTGVRPPKPS